MNRIPFLTEDEIRDGIVSRQRFAEASAEATAAHQTMQRLSHGVGVGYAVEDCVRLLVNIIHQQNVKAGWWNDLHTGESLLGKRNVGEMLCLVHSEISEAMEGHRKNLMDDKLPHRPMIEVELADAAIRIFDIAGGLGMDLAGALREKLEYNASRADHKRENRLAEGGKAY